MTTKTRAKRGKSKKQKVEDREEDIVQSLGDEGAESAEEIEDEEESEDDFDVDGEEEEEEEELDDEGEEQVDTSQSKSARQRKIDALKSQIADLEGSRPKPTEKVRVKVYANKTGFDGFKRIRRGTLFVAEVWKDPETGEPMLAKWMSTPKEWKTILRLEREEEERENQKKGIRGGATGFVEL